jgi:hypothetical protein
MRYIVRRYHRIGNREWQEGEVVEIDDPEYAAWLGRDMQGHLEPVVDAPPAPEPRSVEAPKQDRMVRKARKRDEADEGPITKETFKAVRDK